VTRVVVDVQPVRSNVLLKATLRKKARILLIITSRSDNIAQTVMQ
jgi:hypothetical protein